MSVLYIRDGNGNFIPVLTIQGPPGADARIIAQADPPDDTSVLWVDTSDESGEEGAFANPLYGKSISFNGDSICAGSGDALGGYGKIIADRNNMTCQNIAKGSATITAETYSSSTGNAYHWISRTIEDMDASADFAIVEGGVNDYWREVPMGSLSSGYDAALDDTTFYGAFENMLKQLLVRFAGKKVGFIIVHRSYADGFGWSSESNYYSAAIECCKKWGVPYLDLNTTTAPLAQIESLRNTYTVDGDGSHPTAEGYKRYYCDKIEAWLKTL